MIENQWFKTWFNSPYYHILYQDRNEEEAVFFIDNIFKLLKINPNPSTKVLDLACGKGRHSRHINKKGCLVLGVDIAEDSIHFAKQFQNNNLHFSVEDMRAFLSLEPFDYIFNLFTSFGYFETDKEHMSVIDCGLKNLKPKGKIILDFFNTSKVLLNIVAEEIKTISNIDFHLKRYLKDGFITKDIFFEVEGKKHTFQERVKAYDLKFFTSLFNPKYWIITHILGSYDLKPYSKIESDRMIFIAEKR